MFLYVAIHTRIDIPAYILSRFLLFLAFLPPFPLFLLHSLLLLLDWVQLVRGGIRKARGSIWLFMTRPAIEQVTRGDAPPAK